MPELQLIYLHAFQVEILGVTNGGEPEYFYTVEGLKKMITVEDYTPGGSILPFQKPNACISPDLVLKRPLMTGKTKISKWCEKALDTLDFELTQAYVIALNRESNIIAQWTIEDIYPKGIEIMPLSMNHEMEDIQIGERITIGYSKLMRTK